MERDLETIGDHVLTARLADTHEHLLSEEQWGQITLDPLNAIFHWYALADLQVAGASEADVAELRAFLPPGQALPEPTIDPEDVAARFERIRPAWQASRATGYGEAVELTAHHVLGIDTLSGDALADASHRVTELTRPGRRLGLLRDVAGLDHVQINAGLRPEPDRAAPDFFLHDLDVRALASGRMDVNELQGRSGVEVRHLGTLADAIRALFERHAGRCIAVKTAHAYERPLRWRERLDADAARALDLVLVNGGDAATRECLGDWCIGRLVEAATEHALPVKIHTGHLAGLHRAGFDGVRAAALDPLLRRYPEARFVLMHISYPYDRELIAVAKRSPNVWVDLCWAWSLDPLATMDFVRRFLHAAPSSKLFAFGGDTAFPTHAVGFARQARIWLGRALAAEVRDGYLDAPSATGIADRLMLLNQRACFDLESTRAALRTDLEDA